MRQFDLTAKQLLFCQGIAAGKTQRQAAEEAGSSQPDLMGSKWMRMDKVKDRIASLTAQATAAVERRANGQTRNLARVVEMLWEQAEEQRPGETERMETMPDGSIVRRKFKPHAALVSLREFYQPKGETPVQVQVNVLPPALASQVYRALVGNGNGHHNGDSA